MTRAAVRAVVAAELGLLLRGFDPDLHPRYPAGHELGGKFMKKGSADYKKAVAKAKAAAEKADNKPAVKTKAATAAAKAAAHTKVKPPAAATRPAGKSKPKLPDQEAVGRAYTGKFGDFSTGNVKVKKAGGSAVHVSGDIHIKGRKEPAGRFTRQLRKEHDGTLVAVHENLEIEADLQGQGFAEAFNAQMFDWYRANGVTQVELNADIDVGGYAWARAGYDWKDELAAGSVFARAAAVAKQDSSMGHPRWDKIPAERRAEQIGLVKGLLKRLDPENFDSDDYPTPFEISQLGRWEGAGKDDWWAGKAILMGSDWDAVRHL